MKKYVLIILSISLPLLSFAQRYDYDDIYFNPKKDIVKTVVDPSNKVDNEYSDELKYDNYQDTIPFDEEMSCTDRIQKFHRGGNSNSLDYMLSSDYTNVFILDEGQYHVSVYNDNVDIYEYGYGYYPYYPYYSYSPYYYGYDWRYNYYWNSYWYGYPYSYYSPYYYGWYYDPWYYPYYSCHHNHHHHHDYCDNHYHSSLDWYSYNDSENNRRRIHSRENYAYNVSSINTNASRNVRNNVSSTSNVNSTSRNIPRNSNVELSNKRLGTLPAKPVNVTRQIDSEAVGNSNNSGVSTSRVTSSSTSTVRSSGTSVSNGTSQTRNSTVRSSGSSSRTSSSVRSSSSSRPSSSVRSSGSSISTGRGGGFSSGSSSGSSRRR